MTDSTWINGPLLPQELTGNLLRAQHYWGRAIKSVQGKPLFSKQWGAKPKFMQQLKYNIQEEYKASRPRQFYSTN